MNSSKLQEIYDKRFQFFLDGYEIVEEKRELDGSVELVVTRWTSDGDN